LASADKTIEMGTLDSLCAGAIEMGTLDSLCAGA
jgi:hypothetical protein